MNALEAAENSCKDGDLQKDLEVLFNSQNKSQAGMPHPFLRHSCA
jgi:hypothetical protein